jgi:nitrite reductase/ring-hydroxylating ferredoxin subunit/uncharacterized membrane protein
VPNITEVLQGLVAKIENADGLDQFSKPIASFVQRLVTPRAVRNTLSGTAIGHPLHPVLTDVPIGAWTMATVLDVAGPVFAPAAEVLIGVGLISALPTAAAGWNDWSDLQGPDQRVGLVHAGANIAALSLFGASLALRLSGHQKAGRRVGLAASVGLLGGGYLGGHLAYARGTNVNHTAFEERPHTWTAVLAAGDLGDDTLTKATADDAPVVLYKTGGKIKALADTCTHLGGPLHEGSVKNGCVVCPWHGSTFGLDDGAVVRGPATAPQPVYETRVRKGQIEVRAV